MNCEETMELLEAFHDEELTAETRSAVAVHVGTCATCAAALARLDDLRAAIKGVGPYPLPDDLRQRISRVVAQNDRSSVAARRSWRYGLLAASHIGVALVGGALTYGLLNQSLARTFGTQEIISAHVRSMIDGRLIQVTSADTHTVRPWFAGKIDFSPDVENFDPQNFPLLGGRVDYVGGAKVAALVYSHNNHVINVFVSPVSAAEPRAIQQSTKNGYTIVEWPMADLRYRAVSDLNAVELEDFVKKIEAKAGH
jgi:anti-sigma factor RsiW